MRRIRCMAILAAIALLLTGPNLGLAEEKESSNVRWGYQPLVSKYLASFDFEAERGGQLPPAAAEPLYSKGVALAAEKPSQTGAAAAGAEPAEELSEECLAFQQDPEADLGEVLRAGCKPTLGQMSKLMDNPLGNVAMWINQVDWYRLENDTFDREGDQYNYMGIFQFPKGISEDFNIINRIVYTVPSVPLDQGKVDRLLARATSVPPGSGPAQPPQGLGAAPIDFVGGRTTGFGDMYYVGCCLPRRVSSTRPGAPPFGERASTWPSRRPLKTSWALENGRPVQRRSTPIWGRSGRWGRCGSSTLASRATAIAPMSTSRTFSISFTTASMR